MDGWERIDSKTDSDMIWACQSTALDHYEQHPRSNNIQENVFESSLGRNANGNRPLGLKQNAWNSRDGKSGRDVGKLIDVDTPTSSEEDGEDELKYRLLLRKIDGKKILLKRLETDGTPTASRKVVIEDEEYVIEKGTIVRELDDSNDEKRIIDLLTKTRGWCTPIASIDIKNAYGIVSEGYLTKLTMEEVRILRPIPIEYRYDLHHDFARFSFVRHLKEGDEVEIKDDKSNEMRRGFISSRDRDDRGDYSFSVRMQRGFSPPRERRIEVDSRNPYRFYDDYEGNEHEGSMVYRVSSDRLFAPTRRIDPPSRMNMERVRMRTPSPPREKKINVRVLDSPPAYQLVDLIDIQENRDGIYHQDSDGEWYRQEEPQKTVSGRTRNKSPVPSRERNIPIRIIDSPTNAIVGGGNRTEVNNQGFYRNLNNESNWNTGGPGKPPATKPRTKFDFDPRANPPALIPSLPPSLPPSYHHSNQSTGKDPSRGIGRTNGTENYVRHVQEEDWKMNPSHSRPNGGIMREEEREKKKDKERATSTFQLDAFHGWAAGDRCQWSNGGKTNEATVRWIGRLRGHNSVYAGLEFDEPVGQGTGMYQGKELFNTPGNHAGFVMISTISPLLIPIASNAHPSTFQTQNQARDRQDRQRENGMRMEDGSHAFHKSYPVEDQVRNISPPRDVPISGQGAMVPPRYDIPPSTSSGSSSSARHRPLPPPPSYDADKAMSLRPSPPSIPPRPAMLPEDYMIESFDVDSCVDVCYKGCVRSGVVRWKGDTFNNEEGRLETSVIVELETSEAPPDGWKQSMEAGISGVDHTLSTVLVPLHAVRRDRRFAKDSSPLMGNGSGMNGYGGEEMRGQDFGSIDSGIEISKREPWGGTEELIGRMKGIQGHRNSCYLDSMLYTLFVQCNAFDSILTRRKLDGDIKEYDDLVRILSTEIVWPLRRFHYVRADHVMKFRKELEKAMPNIKGLTSEEKDPEEILSSLFKDVFKTNPYLNLINSKTGKVESTWLYHVVVDAGEWQGNIASSQHLLERSLRKDLTKLSECPQVFIMQLPRYGVTKLFDKIVPLEKIDLTPFINNTVFACAQCQKNPAELYCHECFLTKEALYGEVTFCAECFRSVHSREGLIDHADRPIPPPSRPSKKMTRYTFTLSGVLAIETSHYVSFVRSSQGRWLFFDSMADREGLQNGFNIPQVRECERVGPWLSLNGYQRLRSSPSSLPHDDPLVNRLLSDPYICIYTADQPTVTSSNATTSLLSKLTKLKI